MLLTSRNDEPQRKPPSQTDIKLHETLSYIEELEDRLAAKKEASRKGQSVRSFPDTQSERENENEKPAN